MIHKKHCACTGKEAKDSLDFLIGNKKNCSAHENNFQSVKRNVTCKKFLALASSVVG